MVNISFKYELGEKVRIKELGVDGHVIGLWYGDTGAKYQVAYFYHGDRQVEYLMDKEVRGINSDRVLGFKTNADYLREVDAQTKDVKGSHINFRAE